MLPRRGRKLRFVEVDNDPICFRNFDQTGRCRHSGPQFRSVGLLADNLGWAQVVGGTRGDNRLHEGFSFPGYDRVPLRVEPHGIQGAACRHPQPTSLSHREISETGMAPDFPAIQIENGARFPRPPMLLTFSLGW